MYLTLVRHRVKDYANWRKEFDTNAFLLDKAGVIDTHIVQVNGDPLDIVIINTWSSKRVGVILGRCMLYPNTRKNLKPRRTAV